MADSNRTRGAFATDCEGEGRRGKRGHRGHRGPQGPIGPTGPAGEEGFSPFPENAPLITRIFVRPDGNDVTGDGKSEITAFQTAQHAFTTLPHVIQPGQAIIVDVTGIGVESFPAGYQMPEVHGAALLQASSATDYLPFIFLASLNVWATPQPASNIPLAETTVPAGSVITADPVTGLAIITAPLGTRPSWASDVLKGKMIISDSNAPSSGAIYASNADQLFVAQDAGAIAGNLTIVEPSATFQTPTGTSGDGPGFESADITSLSFGGIAFTCSDGSVALGVENTPQPILELCDIAGLQNESCPEQVLLRSTVVRNSLDIESCQFTLSRSLALDVSSAVLNVDNCAFFRSVFDGNQFSIGPTQFVTSTGAFGGAYEFQQVLIRNSVAPAGAVFAQGFGSYAFENVLIQGASADAIHGEGLVSLVLTNVNGGTGNPGDPANGGYGLSLMDGATARITDDATLVTGSAEGPNSDLKVGVLPVRPWSDFRTNAPIKNQFDLSTPFSFNALSGLTTPAGEETYPAGPTTPGGGSSGSRAFQRP